MKRHLHRHLAHCALASASAAFPLAQPGLAQEARDSLAGEAAAKQQAEAAIPKRYNLPLWSGGVSLSASLQQQYVSNVFLQHEDESDDFIFAPHLKLGAFFPIGRLNTLALNLDTAYYQYFRHDELNTGVPLVSPDTALVFNLYAGDFAIKLSEQFSYQEYPFFEYGAQFYNVYNTGLFRRFDNRVGPAVTWDLHHLVLHGSYTHENFWANDRSYDYINRVSELFAADAMFSVRPWLKLGLEANGSLNAYDHVPWNDNWRVGVGPSARVGISSFLNARLGAGYQRIQLDSQWQPMIGQATTDTFYAYAGLDHIFNQFFRQSFEVSHDNEPGINAANLEGTHLRYSLNWVPHERWSVSPYCDLSFYHEWLGTVSGVRYDEHFTSVLGGLSVGYQLAQNLRVDVSWSYRVKDSDIRAASYDQNRVAVTFTYQF